MTASIVRLVPESLTSLLELVFDVGVLHEIRIYCHRTFLDLVEVHAGTVLLAI